MEIAQSHLIDAIKKLPKFNTYNCEEYRIPILQEPSIIFNEETIPDFYSTTAMELRFIKNYQLKEWCLVIE